MATADQRAAAAQIANPTRFPFDIAIYDPDGVCLARFITPTPAYRYLQTCLEGSTLEGVPGRILLDSVPDNADEPGKPRPGMITPATWRNAPTLLLVDKALRLLDGHGDTYAGEFFREGEYPDFPGYAIALPSRGWHQEVAWTHDLGEAKVIADQFGSLQFTGGGNHYLDRITEGLDGGPVPEKVRLDAIKKRLREMRMMEGGPLWRTVPASIRAVTEDMLPCSGHPRWFNQF